MSNAAGRETLEGDDLETWAALATGCVGPRPLRSMSIGAAAARDGGTSVRGVVVKPSP